MRTNLWIVVVLMAAIVGFLVGYGVSGAAGAKKLETARTEGDLAPAAASAAPASGGYGAPAPAPVKPAAAGGYGAPAPAPAKPAAAGYGAPASPATGR